MSKVIVFFSPVPVSIAIMSIIKLQYNFYLFLSQNNNNIPKTDKTMTLIDNKNNEFIVVIAKPMDMIKNNTEYTYSNFSSVWEKFKYEKDPMKFRVIGFNFRFFLLLSSWLFEIFFRFSKLLVS